jgi:hypothetical protein
MHRTTSLAACRSTGFRTGLARHMLVRASLGRRFAGWKALRLIAVAALACTEFESGTDELTEGAGPTDTRTGALMPAVGRDWSCVGPLRTEAMVARDNTDAVRLVQSIQVLSLVAGTVPRGATVRGCAQRDLSCVTPLTEALPVDEEGWVDVPLYDGFDGYIEVTAPNNMPVMHFYQEPLRSMSRIDSVPLGLVELPVLAQLTGALGTPQNSDFALLALRAFDCQGDPAPGVRFTVDKPTVPFYFVAGLPSSQATETDGDGLGGFINVPIGITVVDASLSSGEVDFTQPRTVFTRPGWMTSLRWIAKDIFPVDESTPAP